MNFATRHDTFADVFTSSWPDQSPQKNRVGPNGQLGPNGDG